MNFNCEQISGVAEVDFYLLSETANWPTVVTDLNSGQITITPEEVAIEGAIDPDSIEIEASPRVNAEGTTFPIEISFRFINRTESLEQLMDQYSNKPGVAIAKLNSGFRKLYGTDEEPLYMNYKVTEGQSVTDKAGTLVTIKGETQQRPVYYTV